MKISNVLFTIAVIILIAWGLGLVFKFTSWLMSGLVGVAAIIVIIGIIMMFVKSKSTGSDNNKE